MGYAITDEQIELAAAVEKFAEKSGALADSRAKEKEILDGALGSHWRDVVEFGLHALAIPEEFDGQGGSLADLGVATEALASRLFPGPFLNTVIVSSLLCAAERNDAQNQILAKFAEGETATFVEVGSDLIEGEIINGVSKPVVGSKSAEWFLIVFGNEDDRKFSLVNRENDSISVLDAPSTDRTRDVGIVQFDSFELPQDSFLTGLKESTYKAIKTALISAEAAGIMRWSSDESTEYAKIREQFGVPIGSFQALKHKLAKLFVDAETATASAWDVTNSLSQSEDQQVMSASAAAINAVWKAPNAVTEAITIFGGIGFTWEHDAHLYLRRALTLAAMVGPLSQHQLELGRLAEYGDRIVEIELPDEDPAFRAQIKEILSEAKNLSNDNDGREGNLGWAAASDTGDRRRFLAEKGLASPHWPKPYGLGATPTEQIIISQEFANAGLTQPSSIIGEWAVPTILGHGTETQKEFFVPATQRGEIVWCQLFSEPGAGSDLAGLSTRATKVDGGWNLQGQKVWTSGAHESDWGICLARSDVEAPKRKGLSYFLVDMRSEGVTVRPLVQSTGEAHFNEVFLDNVFVSDEYLLGEPGNGWKITATTLANERTSIAAGMSSGDELPLKKIITSGEQSVSRDTALSVLGSVVAESIAVGALNLRETMRRVSGAQPGTGASVAKVASAVSARNAMMKLAEISGEWLIIEDASQNPAQSILGLPSGLLGGGTVEIQLNIIADRILMLPR